MGVLCANARAEATVGLWERLLFVYECNALAKMIALHSPTPVCVSSRLRGCESQAVCCCCRVRTWWGFEENVITAISNPRTSKLLTQSLRHHLPNYPGTKSAT